MAGRDPIPIGERPGLFGAGIEHGRQLDAAHEAAFGHEALRDAARADDAQPMDGLGFGAQHGG